DDGRDLFLSPLEVRDALVGGVLVVLVGQVADALGDDRAELAKVVAEAHPVGLAAGLGLLGGGEDDGAGGEGGDDGDLLQHGCARGFDWSRPQRAERPTNGSRGVKNYQPRRRREELSA